MSLIQLLTSLFSQSFIESGAGEMCMALNGTTVNDLTNECDQLFGYLPTYREMIRPGPVLSLFDQFNAENCAAHNCKKVDPIRDYVTVGLCQLRNSTPEEITKFIRHHNPNLIQRSPLEHKKMQADGDDWRLFPLETLAVARGVIDNKMVDIRDNNRLGIR